MKSIWVHVINSAYIIYIYIYKICNLYWSNGDMIPIAVSTWWDKSFVCRWCKLVNLFYFVVQEQAFSDNDAFFAWMFVNRRPLWQTLLSFCWPVLTLAICLFPVYPHQVKLLILYFCAGVLLLILCLLLCKFLHLTSTDMIQQIE